MNKNFLISNLPIGILCLDQHKKVKSANKIVLDLFGYTEQEMLSMSWEELRPNISYLEPSNNNDCIITNALNNQKKIEDLPILINSQSGKEYHWELINIIPEKDQSGNTETTYFYFQNESSKKAEKSRLIDLISDYRIGVWEWHTDTGKVTTNKQWLHTLGYSDFNEIPSDFNEWSKLIHPEDLKRSMDKLNQLIAQNKQQFEFELRMRHNSGEWIWLLILGKITLHNEKSNGVVIEGIHHDITKYKKAEFEISYKLEIEKLFSDISSKFIQAEDINKSINEAFKCLALVNNASRVYLFQIDEKKQLMSNTHEWCQEGVSAEIDNLQDIPLSVFPWWMKQLYKKEVINIQDVASLPSEANVEKEMLESQDIKSLLVLPLFIKNELKGFVGFDNVVSSSTWSLNDEKLLKILGNILSNALERRLGEARLQLLTKAIENSPVNVIVTNKKGEIQYVNKAFERVTGYSFEEAEGKTPVILNSGKHDKEFYANLWSTILSGKTWQGEIINKTKSGKYFWAMELITPIFYNNEITHFVSVTQDISDYKKLFNDLITAKEKAEESDQTKSAFLATMNHELRTPLNHIIGFSELIPDMTDDVSVKSFAQLIHKSGAKLLHLIEDIFDISMIEQGEIAVRSTMFDINEVYIELQKELHDLILVSNKTEDIELKFELINHTNNGQIKADKSKILQIVSNLLKNAVKYTHYGKISLTISLNEGYLLIKVNDTGIGIPKEKQEVIFNLFRQAEETNTREFDGIGIGLAIAQKLALVMNGRIEVSSEEGIGSEFIFEVPVELNLSTEDIAQLQHEVPDLQDKQILIVEDDLISIDVLAKMLNTTNCNVIQSTNGKDAIEKVQNNSDIDIVLLDLMMPVLDGFNTAQKIKAINPDIPIIAITAYTFKTDIKKATESGCSDVIYKPISRDILYHKIKKYI
ncbi:PAS domain S-box protein [Prolixibacteraceae bacterium JC049]|nr:PAS domain S-box protein [Prolixibacteraceae bacterium JC049]